MSELQFRNPRYPLHREERGRKASGGKASGGKARTVTIHAQGDTVTNYSVFACFDRLKVSTRYKPFTQDPGRTTGKLKTERRRGMYIHIYTSIYLSAIARPLPSRARNDFPFRYKKAVALLSSVICTTRIAKNTTLRTPIVTLTCNPASSWSWGNSFKLNSQGNSVNHGLFPLSILQLTKTLSFFAIYLH